MCLSLSFLRIGDELRCFYRRRRERHGRRIVVTASTSAGVHPFLRWMDSMIRKAIQIQTRLVNPRDATPYLPSPRQDALSASSTGAPDWK